MDLRHLLYIRARAYGLSTMDALALVYGPHSTMRNATIVRLPDRLCILR